MLQNYKKYLLLHKNKKQKMKYSYHLITGYPVSCILIAIIWIICIIPIPETPLSDVKIIDKWTHLAMYGALCISIWAEYLRRHQIIDKGKLFIGGVIAPILMGGLVELTQAYCTGGNRSGDWLDFAANGIGVMAGLIAGVLLAAVMMRNRKNKMTDQ